MIDSFSDPVESRLGKCEVCNFNVAKYTCPKCEVKTCSLPCIRIHKKELDCNGIRDKTKFIAKREMTENDLMGDYTFLEECTQYVNNRKQDPVKRYTRFTWNVPRHRVNIEAAAAERNVKLKFLLPNFTKHKANTTRYDLKSKVIYWRVEWHFVNAENVQLIDERCDEQNIIGAMLDERLMANRDALRHYHECDRQLVRVLLKAEGIRKSKNRYWSLDLAKSWRDNLSGKTIVEYPVVYVVSDPDANDFEVIDEGELSFFLLKIHLKVGLIHSFFFLFQMKTMSLAKHEYMSNSISRNRHANANLIRRMNMDQRHPRTCQMRLLAALKQNYPRIYYSPMTPSNGMASWIAMMNEKLEFLE